MEEEIKKDENQEEKLEKEEVIEKKAVEEESTEKPLDKMTAPELREMALEIGGITGVHAMKKEELLAAIKEAKGIKDEEPQKKQKKVKGDINIKELKQKISLLKEEKKTARTAKDRKKVDILRRRINRMKKRTRKVAQS